MIRAIQTKCGLLRFSIWIDSIYDFTFGLIQIQSPLDMRLIISLVHKTNRHKNLLHNTNINFFASYYDITNFIYEWINSHPGTLNVIILFKLLATTSQSTQSSSSPKLIS
jgi:hypothetical protein